MSDNKDSFDLSLDALIRKPKRIIDEKIKDSNIIRIAIYRRVSTREQVDEGQSLMVQKAKIEKYIEFEPVFQDKQAIILDYVDEGKSAKDLKRKGLEGLIKEIKNEKIDFLIVVKLDRLTRRLVDLQYLTDLMARKNVTLLSINEKLDTQSATGRFFLSILGSLAQLEREQISERVQDVFEQIIHSQPLGGYSPFGYVYIKRDNKIKFHLPYLAEFQIEIKVPPLRVEGSDDDLWPGEYAKLIFDWFVSYRSYETIAKKLNGLQIPAPNQIHQLIKDFFALSEHEQKDINYLYVNSAKSSKWNRRTIQNIIENPFYTGTRVYNRYENRLKQERPSSKWKIIQNTHPALITAEFYREVHDIINEIRRN